MYFWKYRSQWSHWTIRSHLLRAKSLCQDFSLPIVLFLQQGEYRGKRDVDWTPEQHLKEFLFFHRTTQEGEIKEVKQLMLFCINCDWKKLLFAGIYMHTEIKLRWPRQTQFSFFRASYILTGQFGCSLLVLICRSVNGKILLTFHEKNPICEILMMIWIKSDAVFKFTTQHLSYKSVEERIMSVIFWMDCLFSLD